VTTDLIALRQDLSRRVALAVIAVVAASLAAIWCLLTYGGFVPALFLPSPSLVWSTGVDMIRSGVFSSDLGISCLRVFGGFLAATLVSIPLGMLMGNFRVTEAAIEPVLGFIRYMPVPAFIPLIILYAGIDEFSKILVIFIGTAVQMVIMVSDVAKKVSAELCRVALTLGASSGEIVRKVVWRASLPGIFQVCRINLGWAWTYLIVAEVLAADAGLGLRIIRAQRFMNTSVIFFYLLVIGCLGLACDMSFKWMERRLFPWARENLR
jgi:NitT/TauT family transport system permease protein